MLKRWMFFIMTVVVITTAQCAFSEQDPIELLKGVTDRMMKELKDNEELLREHPDKISELVNHIAIPHVDFPEMSRWVVGRNAWREASPAVQDEFIDEFSVLVIRTYSRSLLEYLDYTIEFLPLRDKETMLTKKRIEVTSLLKGEGQQLKMNYRLVKSGQSWKVFDIIIENVSLVQGYRAQFSDDIKSNGLPGAVETINRKNATFDFVKKSHLLS